MWLAGKTGCNDVNVSSPRSGIESLDVVPYRSGIERGGRVSESLLQDLLGVGVFLDIADCPGMDTGKLESEAVPPVPGEKRQLS